MAEVIALPHAHQCDIRTPRFQRRGRESVAAAVVRHFEHVDRGEPSRLGQRVQDASLGVAGERDLEVAAYHPEDHAGVVRRQIPGHIGTGRDDGHPHAPQRPGVAGLERADITPELLGGVGGNLGRRTHANPSDPDQARQPIEPGSVVRVVVCEDQRVDSPNAVTTERFSENRHTRAGVHEHDPARVAD